MTDLPKPPQYLQSKLYTARQDRGLIQDLMSPGVRTSADLVVTATGIGRTVSVSAGVAYVLGTTTANLQGTYRAVSESALSFVLDSAVTFPRIDRVVVRIYDGQENNSINDSRGAVEILKGVEASGATLANGTGAQTIPADCLHLADVIVQIGAGYTLSGANVGDKRTYSGLMKLIEGAALANRPSSAPPGTLYRGKTDGHVFLSTSSGWFDLSSSVYTTLPGSPYDGQEILYQTAGMKALKLIWRLRYDSSLSGTAKWLVVSGSPLFSTVEDPVTSVTGHGTSGSFAKTLSAGGSYAGACEVVLPVDGVYQVSTNTQAGATATGGLYTKAALSAPGTPEAGGGWGLLTMIAGGFDTIVTSHQLGLTAGTLSLWLRATVNAQVGFRHIEAMPIALGGTS